MTTALPPPAGYVPSRYLVVGTQTYGHPSGRTLRAVFHTATARSYLLDATTVRALVPAGPDADPDLRALVPADPQVAPAKLDPATVSQLAALGLLVPAGTDEVAAVIAAGRTEATHARERSFVIMPTAYCNMGCDYCGQRHERGASSLATGRHRALIADRVTTALRGDRYDRVRVRWFGGEPLLGFAVIRALSREFTAAAKRHGTGYSALLITNGALLDSRKLRQLYLDCRVERIEVTLDGPPAMHDTSRPLKSGQGSFHRVVAALRAALDDPDLAGLRLSVRTNVSRHNAHLAGAFATAMRDAGLAHPRVTFYPAPVHSWGNDVSDHTVSLDELATVELAWYRAYLEAGLTCTVLPTTTRPVVCTATTRHSEVVAPDGRVYSCTEQPLVPGHAGRNVATLDNLAAGQLRPAGGYDDWYDTLQAGQTGCRDCRLLPLCGGACPKLWREGKPPCPPLKVNIAQRLDLYAGSRALVAT